jgi:hypothetical protein
MATPTIDDLQAQVAAVNVSIQQVFGTVLTLNQDLAALYAAQSQPPSPKPALLSFNTAAHSQYLTVV